MRRTLLTLAASVSLVMSASGFATTQAVGSPLGSSGSTVTAATVAATPGVTITRLATRTAPYRKTVIVTPRATAKVRTTIGSKTLTVTSGGKTVAKNKTSVRLKAGQYRVATRVSYRYWTMVRSTKKVTSRIVGVPADVATPVTCIASSVTVPTAPTTTTTTTATPTPTPTPTPTTPATAPTTPTPTPETVPTPTEPTATEPAGAVAAAAESGSVQLNATCTGAKFDGRVLLTGLEAGFVSDRWSGFDDATNLVEFLAIPAVGVSFGATLYPASDLTKTVVKTTATTTKVWSKVLVRTLTQNLTIKQGRKPNNTNPDAHGDCPSWAPIKGNISTSRGTRIYHVPGGRWYDATFAEKCFTTEAAARSHGFRASKNG